MTARPKFNCKPLEELVRQLAFAPPARRAEQVKRAEKLHDEIEAAVNYPFDFIAYRITGYRRDGDAGVLLVGQALLPDLRRLIDTLSRSIVIPLDDTPTETADELAGRLGVSTKTINRWRSRGLRWRWVTLPGDSVHRRIGITREALDHFMARDPKRVDRARGFTQMTPAQRQELIDQARTLAQERGLTLNQTATALAKRCDRAVETIRLLLEKHDRAHREEAIFTNHLGPLTAHEKRVIARAHRMGVSMAKLTEHFGRTRSTLYRAINERRAADAAQVLLTWVASTTFTRDDADEVFLRRDVGELIAGDGAAFPARPALPVDQLPQPLQAVYHQPRMEEEHQRSLFLRYNYLKFRAARLREHFDRYDVRSGDLDQFDECLRHAAALRSALVRTNLPVVLSVAQRHLVGKLATSTSELLTLLEIGYHELLDAIEPYNARFSQSFDSFLTNRLMRRFSRQHLEAAGAGRAQRRVTGDEALARMIQLGRRTNVDLKLA